jgi:hypothetical protein
MALEASFMKLHAELATLNEAFGGFRVAVHDKPLRGDSVLVDVFGDAADDLLGWVEETLSAALEGRQAASYPADIERARWSLVICHKAFNLISDKLWSDLLSYERITEISTLGRERRGEWLVWASGVKSALDSCREPLHNVNQSIFVCWQEITEHMGTTSVSVQTTNVGQQITVPATKPAPLQDGL